MPRLRPLTPDDAATADRIAALALGRPHTTDPGPLRDFFLARVAHLAVTDPGGAWLAEDDRGRPVGLALALVREGVWGLSLFAVDEQARGTGIGRALLDAAWRHGADAHAQLVLASEHPAAQRLYFDLGLALHPAVGAAGVPDLALADALGREVRGAGHGRDLPVSLAHGSRLLAFEDRAVVLTRQDASPVMVAARDDEAASIVLWAALAAAPRGATLHVEFVDARQQWALRVCHEARLPFSPGGAIFAGGRLGPLRPYLPSGAWL